MAATKEKINKYGVQVGDVFYNSWGYEQTNIDFWQVVALRGTTQIVLRAIGSKVVETCGWCSVIVKPVKDNWTKHYAGEQIIRTVQLYGESVYCNAEHGLLYKTDWNMAHNQTSYY